MGPGVLSLALPVAMATAEAPAEEPLVVLQARAAVQGLDPGDIQRRVTQELGARGFVVRGLPPNGSDMITQLSSAAGSSNAALGVGILMLSRAAVELVVLDRVTGKHLRRALDLSDSDNVASMVALATGELVEASLVELRMQHETLAGEVEPPAALPVPALPSTDPDRGSARWVANASAGTRWPVRTKSVGMSVGLSLASFPIRTLGLGLWADATPVPIRRTYAGSRVTMHPISFGGLLRAHPVSTAHLVVPVELRGGACALPVSATSTAQVRGRSFVRWMGMASLTTGALGLFGPVHAGIVVGLELPAGAPRITAVPDPELPDQQVVLLDMRGPWLHAAAVLGVRW